MKLCVLIFMTALVVSGISYPSWDEYLGGFPEKKLIYEAIEGELGRRQAQYELKIASFASITAYEPGVNNFTDWYTEEIKGNKVINF